MKKNTFQKRSMDIHAFFKNILETTARTIILLVFTYPIFNYMIYLLPWVEREVFLFWRLIDFFELQIKKINYKKNKTRNVEIRNQDL
jgi:hypothetical protein